MEQGATPRLVTDDETTSGGGDRPLVCRACRAVITDERHAIEQGGAHEHVFVNPGGFDHRVRCFGYADGLSERGVPETYFTWFPGYSWQLVHCARCQAHLGWIYRCAGDVFWGLIKEQVVPR